MSSPTSSGPRWSGSTKSQPSESFPCTPEAFMELLDSMSSTGSKRGSASLPGLAPMWMASARSSSSFSGASSRLSRASISWGESMDTHWLVSLLRPPAPRIVPIHGHTDPPKNFWATEPLTPMGSPRASPQGSPIPSRSPSPLTSPTGRGPPPKLKTVTSCSSVVSSGTSAPGSPHSPKLGGTCRFTTVVPASATPEQPALSSPRPAPAGRVPFGPSTVATQTRPLYRFSDWISPGYAMPDPPVDQASAGVLLAEGRQHLVHAASELFSSELREILRRRNNSRSEATSGPLSSFGPTAEASGSDPLPLDRRPSAPEK